MPTISADKTYYVDLGDDPDFTPGSFISMYPEGLTFDDGINAVGNCGFQVSFSAKDQDGSTVVNAHDWIGPYRDYYRLRYGNVAIQAGVVVSTNTILGTDYTSVACKTWEHLLERWEYPFDGRTAPVRHVNDYQFLKSFIGDQLSGTGSLTPPGLVYQANNRDAIRIFGDLFSTTMNLTNRITFDISKLANLSGNKSNFQFTIGDNTKMFNIIDGLRQIDQGFDWWISWNRRLLWAAPYRFGNPDSPVITYTFDGTTADPNDLEFTNNGPVSTHIQGRGSGLATGSTLSRAFGYPPAQEEYSRLDESYDFGDVRNGAQLTSKTHHQFSRDLNPQHVIPLSIDPFRITNFWSTFRKG